MHAKEEEARAEAACLRKERDALLRTVADLQRRNVQCQHETRRHKRDCEKLQDRLRNAVTGKVRIYFCKHGLAYLKHQASWLVHLLCMYSRAWQGFYLWTRKVQQAEPGQLS